MEESFSTLKGLMRTAVVAFLTLVTLPSVSIARTDIVLTVSSAGGSTSFTRNDLEALPKTSFATTTPWTEGVARFEGVRLADFVKFANGPVSRVKAIALNDYSASMKLDDVREHALVAYRMNGKAMTVRNKGPLWIIFPFDDQPGLKSERFYSKSVWQLKAIAFSN